MTLNRRIALAIVLSAALLAALGMRRGFFTPSAAVGVAVCGIVIGTGVARGAFSTTPGSKKRS